MKKLLIGLMFLLVTSAAFADTLTVIKGGYISGKTFAVTYQNMRVSKALTTEGMKNNEYITTDFGLYYKVNGKLYLTSMFELEIE